MVKLIGVGANVIASFDHCDYSEFHKKLLVGYADSCLGWLTINHLMAKWDEVAAHRLDTGACKAEIGY
ncbi:hypothetical protein LPH43_05655 [Xylella taiwanensis]|uniref:Uncharacterized protein n=1 Tax=Xylella taiwanensis TaxID=1444770 RepID=A0ABS8TUP4_9GAMM|nr:hypothetical protein [Xylella taiwanensis]MCD8469710.1 hypothetical protein [Xylella taiwanensis]MCD8472771.1 hypothetical protein [Xylella taiwanensis]UFN03282.1 hypothetical protein LPH43_05655 [Xylella taiwanensis]UFN19184.1 hypothetical protein LPH64_05585 [Xylella taiwanensis]UFN30417.1 hypothetical protein LPH46_05655 [Xylella taiwanensis]